MTVWRNPEFVRRFRAQLRPTRALTIIGLSLVVAVLVGLSSWTAESSFGARSGTFFRWMADIQMAVLGLGCAYYCGQALSQERLLKTFDFLRTTRLSPMELMVGMTLGAPIPAYFFAMCLAVFTIPAGLLGGVSLASILQLYMLLVAVGLFAGLIGLWFSMLNDKSNAAALVFLMTLFVIMMEGLLQSPFPGAGAISPLAAFAQTVDTAGAGGQSATFFGSPIRFLTLTILLYILFGSWLVLMLLRNLKREHTEIRLLRRWQALGFTAFLNVLFYALLAPNSFFGPSEIATVVMGLNALVLIAVGLATLAPRDRLKGWWRGRRHGSESYFSESGLSWPWMVAGAGIAYALFVAASGLLDNVATGTSEIRQAGIQLGVLLIFTLRDILFLQFCTLTGMKRPLSSGFFYLLLYYVASTILVAALGSTRIFLVGLLTPLAVLGQEWAQTGVALGVVVQAVVFVFLLRIVHRRLERMATPVPGVTSVVL